MHSFNALNLTPGASQVNDIDSEKNMLWLELNSQISTYGLFDIRNESQIHRIQDSLSTYNIVSVDVLDIGEDDENPHVILHLQFLKCMSFFGFRTLSERLIGQVGDNFRGRPKSTHEVKLGSTW